MARKRSRSDNPQTDTTEAPAEVETTTNQEAPVSTDTNAAPEAAETKTETKAEKPAEVDLTAFNAAVKEAVENSDKETGTIPEVNLAAVSAEYRKLEGIKAKNAAKNAVNEGMKDAMNSGQMGPARAHLNLSDLALVAAPGSGSAKERVPADPTEAFVQRIATLNLASTLAQSNVPEGVSDEWGGKVTELVQSSTEAGQAYVAWLQGDEETRGDEPEASVVVKNAAKLAQGRSARAGSTKATTSTFTGERRDVGTHIVNAFADKEVGTFLTVSSIRNTKSDEYGEDLPSAGAISARLFPKDKDGNLKESSMVKLGIRPDTQEGKLGAVLVEKVAAE